MTFDLKRFVDVQAGVYEDVLEELRQSRKVGHWIWFVFPQIAGLGRSSMSQRYAIGSLEEARAYLAHPILGARIRECATLLLSAPPGRSAADVLGDLDAMKVRSSMTLFHHADGDDELFARVLDRFYDGSGDPLTEQLIGPRDA